MAWQLSQAMLALSYESETGDMIKHDLMFQPGDSGNVDREHFLVRVYSTH